MSSASQTIAAIATAPAPGGVGIVRVSGPQALAIAQGLGITALQPRQARYARFRDAAGEVIDDGIALYFPGPASFTGEDVLELQGHGSPVLLAALRSRLEGARSAIRDGCDGAALAGQLPGQVAAYLAAQARPKLRPVLNLTGTVLHTNLGRAILAEPNAHLHLYGKREARPGRKMGHVTRIIAAAD